jgi:tetratricopeptide (TPR) repeat protein
MLEEGDNLVLRAHITCGLDIFCLEDSLVDEAAKYNERYVDLRQQYNQSLGHKVERAEYLILSNAYNNLGNAYCAQGKFEKALQTHKMSLDLRLTHNEPLYITLSQANISRVLQFMGRLPDSMSHMETALRLQGLLTGVQDARYALYLHNVGSLLGYMQHWTKAKSVHSEALTIRTAKVNEANDTAVSQHMVADCCFHLGQYDSAW